MGECREEGEHTSLICWGSGEFGQHCHGNGQDVAFEAGTVVEFDSPSWSAQVQLVACGASHTVAVTNSNELYVWGNGNSGQLGCGSSETKWKPEQVDLSALVPPPSQIVGVSCGGRHTVVWMTDGSVVGFGNNSYAQLGQAGGTTLKTNQCSPCLLDYLPHSVTMAACGDKHTVFLMQDGTVACLGNNHHGQIGSEGQKEATLPRVVDLDEPIKQVAAGANHSLALTVSGAVYAWGYGKACHGNSATDVLQPEKLAVASPVLQVAAGSTHSLLVTVSGDVFSWGSGSDGQLGHGEAVTSLPQPTCLPSDVLRGRVVGVACGEGLSAAITDQSDLYLWGRNSHTITPALPSSAPVFQPVCVTGGRAPVRTVSCGAWHASVILNKPGTSCGVIEAVQCSLPQREIHNPTLPPKPPDSSKTNDNVLPTKEVLANDDHVNWPPGEVILPDDKVPVTTDTWPGTFPDEVTPQSVVQSEVVHEEKAVSVLPAVDKSPRRVLPKLQVAAPERVMEFGWNDVLPHLAMAGCDSGHAGAPPTGQERHQVERPLVTDNKNFRVATSDEVTVRSVPVMSGFPKRGWQDHHLLRSRTIHPEQGQYSVQVDRAGRTLLPNPEPYSISVSRSTAAKFTLPKESTFISSKTVGFVPLEQLAENITWNRSANTDSYSWVNKHNSTNIQSNYIAKGYFPNRPSRFLSAKKFAPNKTVQGLSRHHTTLGLKDGMDTSQKKEVSEVRQSRDPNSKLPGRGPIPWWEGTRGSPDSLSTVRSSQRGFTRQQIAQREWDQRTYRRGGAMPDLKPLDRNMRNVNNLKSDYKTVSNARRKKKTSSTARTALVENFSNEDGSKLGEAFASRQQTFILLSSPRD